MRARKFKGLVPLRLVLTSVAPAIHDGRARKPGGGFTIPNTWRKQNAAITTLEVPSADPIGSPKHVFADYYYKIPVRPIYRCYPIYARPRARWPSGTAEATVAADHLGRCRSSADAAEGGRLDKNW
jgi:hypothetical protein